MDMDMILTSGKTSAPLVYAETAFQSGFKHGVADADINSTGSNVDLYYIHQPGKQILQQHSLMDI